MQGIGRIVAVICSILIFIFAIIHLGVSIGILARFHSYGDIFRPERGIAGFNIVVSLLGLLVGGVGIFASASNRGDLCKIVAFASIVLAFFGLVSLITSLAINSMAISYSSNHFMGQMNNYANDDGSRAIIDKIQTKYDCCGGNTWVDWSNVQLNATGSNTNDTEATTAASGGGNGTTAIAGGGGVGGTTVATGGEGGTTVSEGGAGGTTASEGGAGGTTVATGGEGGTTVSEGGEGGTTVATGGGGGTTASEGGAGGTTASEGGAGGTTASEGGEGGTTANAGSAAGGSGIGKRAVNGDESINDFDINADMSLLQKVIRRRRATQSSYGGIVGLPTTFAVTLPESCCTNDLSATDDLTNLYCISNANNISNNFHTDACSPILGKLAVGQTLGLAVINSFLIVLALAAIPILFAIADDATPPGTAYNNELMTHAQPQYGVGGNNAAVYNQNVPNNTYDPAYQAYV